MPKLKINDISIYYEIHGQGEPIVLISGFSADHLIWSEVTNILKNNYQVILLDNRGAGQSDVPDGPYSIDQMAADVADLCSAIGITKAHFVGNSMGGYILQTLAFKHAHLVKTAIISNSTFNTQCPFHLYVDAQLKLLKANVPLDALIQASCSWAFSYRFLTKPNMLNILIQLGLDTPYPFTIAGYEAQYAALDSFDSSEWAGKINVPTLVIGADQDLIFNESSIKALSKAIPNSQYYSFSQCGHLPLIEYPETFSKLISDFVASQKIVVQEI